MIFRSFITVILLFALFYMNSLATESEPQRIAVASEGPEEDSSISSEAARCPFFLIFNDRGDFIEALENPIGREKRGAGSMVVEFLDSIGVKTVIAQKYGGKMSAAMKIKGMSFYEEKGSATDAVKRVLKPEKE